MDLEHKAVERLKTASEMSLGYYGKPLVCTYSGGKDSDVMLELFKRADIPYEVHHSPWSSRHTKKCTSMPLTGCWKSGKKKGLNIVMKHIKGGKAGKRFSTGGWKTGT